MSECPELVSLESLPLQDSVQSHVAACASCKLVVELFEQARGVPDAERDCLRFDALLAARSDGSLGSAGINLLERHLAGCSDCRAVAETLSPKADTRGDHATFPRVDPGAYALGLEVDRGGMGRVLAARDLRIGRPVAVKELLGRSPQLAARFEREARVTARLQHPGIVPIYEIGRWPDGTPFYAMRMVAGVTLQKAIAKADSIAARIALLPALIAATEAVAFAHDQHVIHRDLTPSNVMVGAYGETVVIDWGLAKDLADASDDQLEAGPYREERAEGLTNVGAVIGTAAYMPPEQANGAPVDERADVYALGAILYHVLAGEPPYRPSKSDDVLRQLRTAPPKPIGDRAPGAPRDLASIVDKSMSRDPAGRYANAGELAVELRRFQTGQVVAAHDYSPREKVRRWVGRHKAGVIAASATLAALVVTGTIAIAGIVREKARAEAGEREAVHQRTAADQTNAELLEEQGRQALLAGNPVQASVWLSASYGAGNTRPSLRFLLASSMRDVEALERQLDCESNVQSIEPSPDKTMILAGCAGSLRVWRVSDGSLIRAVIANVGLSGARWSHDGRSIVGWSGDGSARIWDAATGELRFTLQGHTARLSNAMFTPDDRRLLTASFDRTVRVWDSASGTLIRTIVAASPSQVGVRAGFVGDDRIVTTSTDGEIRVWDLESGALLRSIANGGQIIGGDLQTASFTRTEAHRVVVCGRDTFARIWDLDTGALVRTFAGHSDTVWHCEWSADRHRLLTTSSDGTAKVWNAETGRLQQSLNHGGVVTEAAFSPDGQTVVTGGMGNGIRVWDVPSGMLLGADDTASVMAKRLAVVDGRIFAGDDSLVRVWRGLGTRFRAFRPPAGMKIAHLSADATRAAVDDHGAITIWDAEHNTVVAHEPLRQPTIENANLLAAQTATGVAIVDMHTGVTTARLPSIRTAARLEISGDARYLLVKREDDRSEVWDVRRGVEIAHWDATDFVAGLATGLDRVVVWKGVSERDPVCEVWSLEPPRLERRIAIGRQVPITDGMAWFSPDKSRLLLGANDHVARLWDLTTARELRAIPVAMFATGDPTSSIAVVTTWSGKIELIRVSDGTTASSFPILAGAADVTADGALVAGAAMLSPMVNLWDSHGRVLASLHYPNVESITEDAFQIDPRRPVFTSDGSRLVSVGTEDYVSMELALEQRAPAEVARIVRARSMWTVDAGHLVPTAEQAATVSGRVTRMGAGVGGATVTVFSRADGSPITTAVSGSTGEFDIHDLPAGEIRIMASTPEAFTKRRDTKLVAGENRIDLDLDLAAVVSGQIVDSSGHPVGSVHVHADCTGCEQPDSGDDTTTAEGRFTLKALMGGGQYVLYVLVKGKNERLLEPVEGQHPIHVKDGTDHVTGVRFAVKAEPSRAVSNETEP